MQIMLKFLTTPNENFNKWQVMEHQQRQLSQASGRKQRFTDRFVYLHQNIDILSSQLIKVD